jgi:hypothetical protein
MSQINAERLLGRLITDRALRLLFDVDPLDAIRAWQLGGARLTDDEAEALSQIDLGLVERLARALDPRLRRVCLQLRSAERHERAPVAAPPRA